MTGCSNKAASIYFTTLPGRCATRVGGGMCNLVAHKRTNLRHKDIYTEIEEWRQRDTSLAIKNLLDY